MSEEAFYIAILKVFLGGIKNKIKAIFKKAPASIGEIKKYTQVLFIDDESMDFLLNNIRQAGWNARQINDVSNFDVEEIKNADIIFVDYKNVGTIMTPTEEGIGLVKELRRRYPKKHIIFYSGYAGTIPGHEIHNISDDWIPKNSDPYVYIERIELAAKEIYDRR